MVEAAISAAFSVAFDRLAPDQKSILDFVGKKKGLQLDRLESARETISVFLENAENKEGTSPTVQTWFINLKHAMHQSEDLLDEVTIECSRIKLQCPEGNFSDEFITELSPRLEKVCQLLETKVRQIGELGLEILYDKQKRENKPAPTSVVVQSHIFGRDAEKEKIIEMVLSGEGAADVCAIPITGMGGIGKTTLAQLVYNDERVKNQFDTGAWVCVSQEFDLYRITKAILMEVNSSLVDERDDLNRLQVKLKCSLQVKRFIIILDDVWNHNYDECQRLMVPLNSGRRGSKIVVTTRNENIALMLQDEPFHCLQPIPNEESWSLFKLHASFDTRDPSLSHEFEETGKKIVEMCKGLPLAIKTVAGALRSKGDIHEWRDILDSDNWMVVSDILPSLNLSYKLLPSHLKSCFGFCSLFPKNVPFDKDELVLLWMANGLVQPSSKKVAQYYFEELRSRAFFECVNNNMYVMHNLVNDLARIVSGNFCARLEDYQLRDLQGKIEVDNGLPLPPEVLHFSYTSERTENLERFRGLAQVQGLRTFLPIHQSGQQFNYLAKPFFSDILPKHRHIRALSLRHYGFPMIPDSIGNLKHLRFLNLSSNLIAKLPIDITKCVNLQTLILADCVNLRELPGDIGLLINLQHLDISGCIMLRELPEDIQLLNNLQHIDVRGVGFNNIDKMESWLIKLGDIQNLSIVVNELHGSALERLYKFEPGQHLEISELDDAVTVEMARKADLKNKNCIENLSLKWRGTAESLTLELNVFAELIPHTNIRQLNIKRYRGTAFSDWLGDPSFCKIEVLTLKGCKNCSRLPPLGQLTGLKKLEISGMAGIKQVGEEFYGITEVGTLFPVLEELRFSNMAGWITWNITPGNTVFLSLKELWITGCPKLVGDIPYHLTSLRILEMSGLHSLHLNQGAPVISSDFEEAIQGGFGNLDLEDCPNVSYADLRP